MKHSHNLALPVSMWSMRVLAVNSCKHWTWCKYLHNNTWISVEQTSSQSIPYGNTSFSWRITHLGQQVALIVIRTSGCTKAQAVSCRFPTAAAPVLTRVRSCGICGGQGSTGTGFCENFVFPFRSSFHQFLYNYNLSSGTGTIGQ
jgi:hypothetical protein